MAGRNGEPVDGTHRVLAIDPGAVRAGWAVLEEGKYVSSGVVHTPRPQTEPFQEYRMRITKEWWEWGSTWILSTWPTVLVNEIVPYAPNLTSAQIYLTNVMVSVLHAVAIRYDREIVQVSARTVQSSIAKRGNSKGITKPQVRNGVLERLPELQPRLKDFTKVFEETDALAIGLWYYLEAANVL